MSANWWTRAVAVAVAVVAAIVLLVPTVFERTLENPSDRETWPGWYTRVHDALGGAKLNWGLDLVGGLHLQYHVDIDKAIDDRISRFANDLRNGIRRDHPDATATVELLEDEQAIVVRAEGASPRDLVTEEQLFNMRLNVASQADGSIRLTIDPAYVAETASYAINQAIETIRKRVDASGVAEPSISRRGDADIVVQLPGLDQTQFEQMKSVISQTAQLEFKMVSENSQTFVMGLQVPAGSTEITAGDGGVPQSMSIQALEDAFGSTETPEGTELAWSRVERFDRGVGQIVLDGYRPILIESSSQLTGEYVTDARVVNDPQTNWPVVSMTFDAEGGRLFGQLTTENVDRQMAVVLDGVVRSAPNINEPILGGRAQITMGQSGSYNQTFAEAENLSIVLRNGALPAPIEKQFETQVGPTLGHDSIRAGMLSGLVGFGLVFAFMLYYYRLAGVVANIALAVNLLFIFAGLALIGATITLPGIAGITLTVGMAVDANVIIYERMREESARGHDLRRVIELGYDKALSAIVDSNVTTAIAGLVLLEYGSGPVRGFAVTLLLGIASTMVAAVIVTRLILELFVERFGVRRLAF
jgi:preprotein translocase subunit SecD